MGLSEDEGNPSSQQPEGGLLSLLGDMLFAGAILVMLYPSLHRTIKRVDRQFCRQFWHVTQVIVPLAALSFVLMLMIAQQTRMAYCSLVRPLTGDHPEDGAIYAGVLLKILFCALLVFNYFCACRLHQLVGMYFPRFRTHETGHRGSAFSATASWRARSEPSGEAFSNNSNTNSPTTTYSDIFSTISNSPVPDSVSLEDQSHTAESQRRLFCDVGTMVRFPEYPRSWCPLQFCHGQAVQFPRRCCDQKSSLPGPLPCSPSSPFLSSAAGSTGFCSVPPTDVYHHGPVCAGSSHHHMGSCGWVPVAPAKVTGGNHQGGSSGVACVPSDSNIRTRLRSASSINNSSNRQGNVVRATIVQESSRTEMGRCPGDPRHPPCEQNVVNTSSVHSSISSAAAYPTCSFHCPSVTSSSSQTPLRGLARQGIGGVHVKRRCHPLPTMLKMTRSGKIYGYG